MNLQTQVEPQIRENHVVAPVPPRALTRVPSSSVRNKLLLIGQSNETFILAENINRSAKNYRVAGCLRLNSREPVAKMPHTVVPILGDLTELEILMAIAPPKLRIILISDPEIRHHQILKIIDFARIHNLEVWVRPQLAAAFYGDLKFHNFFGHPIIKIIRTPARLKRWTKTVFDYTAAITGLLAAAPIMLLVALLIRLTSRGPILYRQTRVGRNHRYFNVIKFRSIYADAEAESGPVLCSQHDQRVTPLGRFLRLTHFDELPQFFNILNGTDRKSVV